MLKAKPGLRRGGRALALSGRSRGILDLLGYSTRRLFAAQAAADLADGLAEAVLIFHQSEAQIAFADLAEAAAGADSNFGFFEQFQGEVDGAKSVAPFLGVLRPDEHAGFRPVHVPANAAQAVYQHVAAALILGGLTIHQFIAVAQGEDAGNLNGLEDAVVVVAL